MGKNTLTKFSFSFILFISILTAESNNVLAAHAKHQYGNEKLCKFTVYWHDQVSGHHPTSVSIVSPPPYPNNNNSFFGLVQMIDNKLTLDGDPKSKSIGRAQGFYAAASLDPKDIALLMTMNFYFTDGKYKGSTLEILGRNAFMNKVREMPIVGGSGLFRFARGYALLSTKMLNQSTGDAIVKYDLYVMHY
ncbi:disease resistance-responsive (dirigent-likeprotein) family protein [Striga asiatica]|uniref:Dirigent protein n=1 Tax=Striga asiatica TaxID=4170 RepID=A0A5A7QZ24_STRAF|nr:disease resistance-responsive (dirigent-likeprotein) family protein [Striga asiatica]